MKGEAVTRRGAGGGTINSPKTINQNRVKTMGTSATATIFGYVGKKPELRKTGSGKAVTSFSIATNDRRGGEETTTWHNITAWEQRAEICCKALDKGSQVLVKGRITQEEWQGKDGQER